MDSHQFIALVAGIVIGFVINYVVRSKGQTHHHYDFSNVKDVNIQAPKITWNHNEPTQEQSP